MLYQKSVNIQHVYTHVILEPSEHVSFLLFTLFLDHADMCFFTLSPNSILLLCIGHIFQMNSDKVCTDSYSQPPRFKLPLLRGLMAKLGRLEHSLQSMMKLRPRPTTSKSWWLLASNSFVVTQNDSMVMIRDTIFDLSGGVKYGPHMQAERTETMYE